MLNIMKNIARRYWLFLLMILVLAVISFLTIEDRAAFPVLIFMSFFTIVATDLKTIIFECSLPLDRKRVVDARFLLLFILLMPITVIFTPMALKYDQLSRFAPVLMLTFCATSVWMMYIFCFGNGQLNLLMGIVMTLFLLFMVIISVSESLFLDALECFLLISAGIAVYAILWIISRNRIGKADI